LGEKALIQIGVPGASFAGVFNGLWKLPVDNGGIRLLTMVSMPDKYIHV